MNTLILIEFFFFDCDEWVGDDVCLPFKDISGNLFLNKMFTLRIKSSIEVFWLPFVLFFVKGLHFI